LRVKHTIEEQLILHEGLKLEVYKCLAGYWTIGVGRNLEGKGISHDEAMLLLRNDIAEVTAQLERFDWFTALGPIRQKVLIDMCFNLGIQGLLRFQKMIEALKRADYERAADEMVNSRWYGQVGERGRRLRDEEGPRGCRND
jgi:lysozyme